MSTFAVTIRILSIIISILSIVSVFVAILDLGLIHVLERLLEYYRTVSYSIIGFPFSLLGVSPPQFLVDLWVLSLIGAGAYARAEGVETCRAFRHKELKSPSIPLRVGVFLLFGITGIGIFIILSAVSPLTYLNEMHDEPLDIMQSAAKNLVWVCSGALAFFVLNAFAPS